MITTGIFFVILYIFFVVNEKTLDIKYDIEKTKSLKTRTRLLDSKGGIELAAKQERDNNFRTLY